MSLPESGIVAVELIVCTRWNRVEASDLASATTRRSGQSPLPLAALEPADEPESVIRALAIVVAALVILTAGSAVQGSTPAAPGSGDAAGFCARWEDARSALLDEGFDDFDEGNQDRDEVADAQVATLDEVDPLVPEELRDDWDTAAGFRRDVTDVLFTVNFAPELVRPIHLDLALGDTDPEAVEAEAMAAVEALDAWTVAGCGDFCSRWPQIERAVRPPTDGNGNWDPERAFRDEAASVRLLSGVEALVPTELAIPWQHVTQWRSIVTESVAAREESEQYFELDDDLEQLGMNFEDYLQEFDRRLVPIVEWLEANCESFTAGARTAGTMAVTIPFSPEAAGTELFATVVEPGTPVTGLTSTESLLGVACFPATESERDRAFELRALGGARQLCGPQPELVVLDPGVYDVVVLSVIGLDSGDIGRFIPAPEFCTRTPIVIDGDTTIELPPLEACSLGPVAGDPADVEGNEASAVDPSTPGAGSMRIVIPDAFSPVRAPEAEANEQDAGGWITGVVLPAGTELEEVGRREVWPSGVMCLQLFTPEFIAERGGDSQAEVDGPFALPVVELPPSGVAPACHFPFGLSNRLARDLVLPPTLLGPGSYDVYLEASISRDGSQGVPDDQRRCFSAEVTVEGDVLVEPPLLSEWGPCP